MSTPGPAPESAPDQAPEAARSAERLSSLPPGPVTYVLGDKDVVTRAAAVSALGAATGLAPLILAAELLARSRQSLPPTFWFVGAGVAVLLVVRSSVQFQAARRRLRSLRITVDEGTIAARSARDAVEIRRAQVGRVVDVEGPLGGLRVEAIGYDAGGGLSIRVPRGGEGFGDVRARLERWRPVERRGRRGPLVRVAIGAAVVAAIFFLPFVLEDVVARSQWVAVALVLLAWAAMRWAVRGR